MNFSVKFRCAGTMPSAAMPLRRPTRIRIERRRIHGIGRAAAIVQKRGNVRKNRRIISQKFRGNARLRRRKRIRKRTPTRQNKNFFRRKSIGVFRADFFKIRCGNAFADAQNIPRIHAGFRRDDKIAFPRKRSHKQVRNEIQTAERKHGTHGNAARGIERKPRANARGGNANAQNRAGTFAEKKTRNRFFVPADLLRRGKNALERGSLHFGKRTPLAPAFAERSRRDRKRRRRIEQQIILKIHARN